MLVQSSKNFTNISITPHVGGLTYRSEVKAVNEFYINLKVNILKI